MQFRKGMLGPLARGKHLATDYAEAAKRSAKAAACAANNYDFMTWASRVEHTRRHWPRGSGVVHHRLRRQGRPGALRRREVASAQNERKRLLQQHSAIIARRNWEIAQRNAWPRMGGVAPRAPPVEQ